MHKVLLYGINGVYNYGCEAIVRGTIELLKRTSPDVEITLASQRPSDDKRRLADCPINIVPRQVKGRYSPQRVLRSLSLRFGIPFYPCIDDLKQLEGIDTVISIGGDIYTLNHNGRMDTLLFRFGEEVQRRGIPYILWGASIGPFTKNPQVELRMRDHLQQVTRIYAREELTIDYLVSIRKQ